MERSRVRYFLAVCEHGSFVAAATACGVTQPTISTAVSRLERALGGKLFERRHPVKLTQLACDVRPLLQTMHATAEAIEKIAQQRRRAAAAETRNKPESRPRRAARGWYRSGNAPRPGRDRA
jgi:DNA-binding transcriptional LysR family regulator